MMGAFIIVGLVVIAAGVFVCWVNIQETEAAESFTAEIVGWDEKIDIVECVPVKEYCPIARYRKNGSVVTVNHRKYGQKIQFDHTVGETVTICVNPADKKHFWFADEEHRIPFGGVAVIACGALTTVLGIVFIALS